MIDEALEALDAEFDEVGALDLLLVTDLSPKEMSLAS